VEESGIFSGSTRKQRSVQGLDQSPYKGKKVGGGGGGGGGGGLHSEKAQAYAKLMIQRVGIV